MKNKWNFYKIILKEEWVYIFYKIIQLIFILNLENEIKVIILLYYCMDLHDGISNRMLVFNNGIKITARDMIIRIKENKIYELEKEMEELKNEN